VGQLRRTLYYLFFFTFYARFSLLVAHGLMSVPVPVSEWNDSSLEWPTA